MLMFLEFLLWRSGLRIWYCLQGGWVSTSGTELPHAVVVAKKRKKEKKKKKKAHVLLTYSIGGKTDS